MFSFFIAHLVAFSPTHQTAQQILCVVLIHIHKSLSPSSRREKGSKRPPSGPHQHRRLLSRCNNNQVDNIQRDPMRTTTKKRTGHCAGHLITCRPIKLLSSSFFFLLPFSVVDIVAIFHLQDSRLLIFFFSRSTSGVHRLHHHNHKEPQSVPVIHTLCCSII